ncbi:MAG: hypothetical protein BMS9Abin34_057 [Patescibacteria group bacterium]|nr:MAG: hypothetical protein BMS9Abin34_057 [Patescibacteria group bacterium]
MVKVFKVIAAVLILAALAVLLGALVGNRGPSSSQQSPTQKDWTKKYGVFSIKPDGSDLKLIYQSDSQLNHLHVSPDSTKILFSEFTNDLNGDGTANEADLFSAEVGVMNIDGTGRKLLTGPDGNIDAVPVWSPDGTKILFASSRGTPAGKLNLDLYIMNSAGKSVRKLTATPEVIEADPHWIGKKIAFARLVLGENQQAIWMMDSDGRDAKQVTFPSFPNRSKAPFGFGDFDPKISPDGKKIASYRHLDDNLKVAGLLIGNYDLFIINTDGTERKVLTNTPSIAEIMPTWSPDGKKLAFWVLWKKGMGLRIINADGTGEREVQIDLGQDVGAEMPSWFPDGQRLIFSAQKF